MVKSFLSLLLVFVVNVVVTFAQDFDFQFVQSQNPVDRQGGWISADAKILNKKVIKDLKVKVKVKYINCVDFAALPFPAFMVKADGVTKDDSKWSKVSEPDNGVYEFHYWMADVAKDYLKDSADLRKVMEFFLKTSKTIPDCGEVAIILDTFRVQFVTTTGVLDTVFPISRSITIKLGDCPNPTKTIDLLADEKVTRTATVNNLDLMFNYLSDSSFHDVAFDVSVPASWPAPTYSFVNDSASVVISANGTKYHVAITAKHNFPRSLSYRQLVNLQWAFSAAASGKVDLVFDGFVIHDSLNRSLPVISQYKKTVDLGKPIDNPVDTVKTDTAKTVKFSLMPIVKPAVLDHREVGAGRFTMSLDMDNLLKKVRTVSFQLTVPAYFSLDSVINRFDNRLATFNQINKTDETRSYLVTIQAKDGAWLPNSSTENPKSLAWLVFRFFDLKPAVDSFKITLLNANSPEDQVLNATKTLVAVYDFEPFFANFRRGDAASWVRYNFGDGILDNDDLALISDYQAGRFTNPTWYQRWALDYNGDGLINQKDYDQLKAKIPVISSSDDTKMTTSTVVYSIHNDQMTIGVPDTGLSSQLLVYSSTGVMIYSADLRSGITTLNMNLSSGAYYFNIHGPYPVANFFLVIK